MSVFIGTIASRGFSDRPPLSYVMPLSSKHHTRGPGVEFWRRVRQLDQSRRPGRAHHDRDDPAEPLRCQHLLVPNGHSQSPSVGNLSGAESQPLGILDIGGHVDEITGEPAGAGDGTAATAAARPGPVDVRTSSRSGAWGPSGLRSA
jgi:hypothetical protein